ncbi:CBS domain-containing protein [Candidatus Woesearchaeota archaeon]|jgi:CBS domain-containing protein|nr:CBS domain-containing protein [Candidatus Woesearchaeota archaeon]MBT5397030.1 CBS domain-containing protein [Candidatus Woesearchaeota archaeon]MBT5924935.1 CBS domain-containing protein [Candidatus Woesearchaeota archaeon]MBT6367424.1 CBS domain-containing protein [Candidatus Woesearchaeota archaeon]MBT7762430.1 CBS domain-containing protein [Candidatus Woesearchaeota archaeon]
MDITPIIQEDFIVLEDTSTISTMIGQLRQYEKRAGLVFRNKKYVGLVEKKKLFRKRIDTTKEKVAKFVQKTPIIGSHADILETAYMLFKSDLEFVPVEQNKSIVGVVRAIDVVKEALNLPEAKHCKVEDVKSVKLPTLNKDAPLATAMNIMYQNSVDHVPIFESGELYGIISHKDVLRKYLNWSPKRDMSARFNKMARTKAAQVDSVQLAALPVHNFSTNENLVTIQRSASSKEAVKKMVQRKVSSLLIMDGNEYVGLLTVKNLLRWVASLKVPENFNIAFVGLKKLRWDDYEKEALQKIASNEAFKLQRQIKNEFSLTLHIKEYEKDGRKQKYAINLHVEFPGKMFSVSQEDWDWRTAVRKTFNNAKNKAHKMFRD